LAALEGKREVFRYLTEIGAIIIISNAKDDRAFHSAALLGSVDMIILLLDKGISVNLTNTKRLYSAVCFS
jgi:ankyrin repeat protein